MSESTHLKCPCQHCGSSIEFPAHGVGMTVQCPHCSGTTTLIAPSADPDEAATGSATTSTASDTSPPDLEANNSSEVAETADPTSSRQGRKVWLAIVAVVLAAGVVGFLIARKKPKEEQAMGSSKPRTNAPSVAAVAAASGALTAPATNAGVLAHATKSVDDLKVGPIKLEKAKGSSLVYAVGVMKNASDFQRFGVTVELDVADAGGKKVGTAKDYRAVIEPRQEWRFRALVLDSKAVSARVAQIREEE